MSQVESHGQGTHTVDTGHGERGMFDRTQGVLDAVDVTLHQGLAGPKLHI